jgi:DNA-binding transcriptional LysR family regulator
VLEREAGVAVLERTGRRVTVTAAGMVLVEHAARLLEGVEAAEAELAAVVAGRPAGFVRIAAFQSALLHLVAPMVQTLQRTLPAIRVNATEAEVEHSVSALALNHVDVVVGDEYIGTPRPVHADLNRQTLLTEHLNVVLPADHSEAARRSVRLGHLHKIPWAACQPGTGQHQSHLRICRQLGGFEPDTRYTTDDFATLIELVRTTGAATLLPDLPLTNAHLGVAVRRIEAPETGREIYVLTRRHRTPLVNAVVHALETSASALRAVHSATRA